MDELQLEYTPILLQLVDRSIIKLEGVLEYILVSQY